MPIIHLPMAVLKMGFRLWVYIALAFCVSANAEYTLTLDNKLAACVSIDSVEVDGKALIPTIDLSFTSKKLTAECGCKSRINTYQSYIDSGNYPLLLMSGNFTFTDATPITLPLAAQSNLIGDSKTFSLSIACASPQ